MRVTGLHATRIRNSRGENTIQIKASCIEPKVFGIGSAPSGASKSKYEAPAYPKGLDYSINLANKTVAKSLKGFNFEEFSDLQEVEKLLPKNFGANPTIALEFALLNAWAADENKPLWWLLNSKAKKLPRILANVVGGGAHFKGKSIDFQEILLSPSTGKINEDVEATLEFHSELKNILRAKKQTDEGAWVPSEDFDIADIFETLLKVTGYEHGVDIAANQFFKNGKYVWQNLWKHKSVLADKKKQIDLVRSFALEYNLFYVEDPLHQDDFAGFAELRKRLPGVIICGDDLIATNLARLKKAVKMKAISGVIIKPNQAGSLVKTKDVFDYAIKHGIKPIVSHRSGETMDATIAQLAFAWQAPFVKFGIAQKERMAKLNALIDIEKNI